MWAVPIGSKVIRDFFVRRDRGVGEGGRDEVEGEKKIKGTLHIPSIRSQSGGGAHHVSRVSKVTGVNETKICGLLISQKQCREGESG